MTYLLLYGDGWTQRWQLADDAADQTLAEIARVGHDETSQVTVLDPGSGAPTTLMVAWKHVASAVLLGSELDTTAVNASSGQYR
jgi:hypothetical protein